MHGGGREPDPRLWQPYLAAAGVARPTIAVVVLGDDGPDEIFARWALTLRQAGPCKPVRIEVTAADPLGADQLDGADAVFVGHGLTPDYATAVPREALLPLNIPYAGSSAGAAVASTQAIVGGWLLGGRPVCPEDTAENLDPLTVVAGIGLHDFAVDVHAAQWGTLSRLVAAVDAGLVAKGIAIDEETIVRIDDNAITSVTGTGHAWLVEGASVTRLVAAT